MNHVVILDAVANEIKDLLRGDKSMIIHGADAINIPYGIVAVGDVLYFVDNNDQSAVKAKGIVSSVYNSYKLTAEESYEMIIRNQDKLRLPDDLFYKWAGKKYLVMIGLRDVEEVKSLLTDRNIPINTVDWLPLKTNEEPVFLDIKPPEHTLDGNSVIVRLPISTSGAA